MSDSLLRRCPSCGVFYRQFERCPRDGLALVPAKDTIDRYRILDHVGDGSMGVVYRAQHTLLDNRVVAIKLLHRHLAEMPGAVDRFFREAKAASQLKNEHIVEVIDFGRAADGDSFLVMELLDGPSLRDVLTREKVLPLGRAVDLVLQIADGLGAAHQRGTVHRDLKPENVVLVAGESGECVKLLDFGIAQLAEYEGTRLTQAGVVLGTPAYMSPEQASGNPVDHRTDVYALGTILYEMLTGRCPYEGETTREVLMRKLTGQFPLPRQIRPELPLPLEAVMVHALEWRPERRPQSMRALAEELRDASTARTSSMRRLVAPSVPEPGPVFEEPEEPEPLPLPRRAARPDRWRRPLLIVGPAMGLAIGIGLTLLFTGGSGNRSREEAKVRPPSRDAAPSPVSVTEPRSGPRETAPAPAPRGPRSLSAIRVHGGRHTGAPSGKPPPVTPRKGMVRIGSRPEGADVYDEKDVLLGRTPLQVSAARSRDLTLFRVGYQTAKTHIPEGSTRAFSVKLAPKTMSWEVMNQTQLKQMLDRGEISASTYRRRQQDLRLKRDEKLFEAKMKLKTGEYTPQQYERVVKAIRESYR
jgi:serine/threonine-protein kinase